MVGEIFGVDGLVILVVLGQLGLDQPPPLALGPWSMPLRSRQQHLGGRRIVETPLDAPLIVVSWFLDRNRRAQFP